MLRRPPRSEPGIVRRVEQDRGAMIGIDHLARKYDLVAHLPADLAEAGQRDVERPRPGAEIDVAGHQPRQPERPPDRSHRQILAVRHRSEEHTSELQALMRISYDGFSFKQKKPNNKQ